MAENKNIELGGRLHSIATGNVLAGANEIFDDDKNKKQNEINTETYSLVNNINERLNSLSPDQQSALNVATKATNNETKLGYYVCDTEGNVAAKVISNATGYVLSTGGSIKVKITNANTANNATLNINSTGAKPLFYDGERASANNTWEAGETVEVYYDGTNFYANNVAGSGGEGVFDVSEKYPTSGVEGGNTYTLEGALTVLNTNLPTSKKKGGMSIKFIQSSDNKYVQYRLMADSWSINTDDWSFCGDNVLVENPEWIYVLLDAEKRILAGLKSDGSVEWSIGIPIPVKAYIDNAIAEIKNGTEETNLDGLNKIITFLSDFSTSDTLKNLLDTKVDKEQGKSLIDAEYATGISYIENPEFAAAYLDHDDKILFGVKTGGDFYFGYGVPTQIVDYIQQLLVDYDDIVTFLSGMLGEKPIFSNKKVSIIGDSISTFIGYIPEDYPSWYPHEGDRSSDVTSVNDTWWKKLIDATNSTLEVNASYSGSTASSIVSGFSPRVPLLGTPDTIIIALGTNDSARSVEIGDINFDAISYDLTKFAPAYIKGIQDTIKMYPDARIICLAFDMSDAYRDTIKTIANHYCVDYIYVGDVSDVHPNKAEMQAVFDKVYNTWSLAGILNNKVDKIKGKGLIQNEVSESLSAIEDPEGRTEITTDSENKIVSYRDTNGVKHENVGIETKEVVTSVLTTDNLFAENVHIAGGDAEFNSLNLTEEGMTEFQQALINSGFNPKMPIDWSDEEELRLPIPRTCAKVNLIVENLPTSKTANYSAMLEYSDLDGNYFKKPIILNAQGSSSMQYVEKNLGFDLDDGSEIQFGNWVAQDSFHLKCYYIDVFRGEANICYNYTNEVIKYLNCRANRVLNDNSATTTSNGIGKFNKDFGSSALCQPDGFPIEVYHNGTYYGLFAWNLKKNRKNYQMKKDDYSQALMDGEIHSGSFFGGTINWRLFELRNPKTLYLMDGVTKYDGENPQEIISPTMIVEGQEVPNPNYDANNSNHVKTYQTKAMLEELSQIVPTLNGMTIDTPEGLQAAKTLYEAHFDKDMMICYFILSNVLFHPDGFAKNWIWTVYNGIAAPTFYDMDTMFGRHWTGGKMWPGFNTSSILGNDVYQPCGQLYRLYRTDIETVYADLRVKKYIDVDYIISFFNDWLNRQTREAVERNIEKWTAIPSYRENGGSYPPPLSYNDSVKNDGMYDSIGRVKKWLEARIPALDIFFNYNQN